jgi:hypothetical protein
MNSKILVPNGARTPNLLHWRRTLIASRPPGVEANKFETFETFKSTECNIYLKKLRRAGVKQWTSKSSFKKKFTH